jgi:hypothetical protein
VVDEAELDQQDQRAKDRHKNLPRNSLPPFCPAAGRRARTFASV